MWYVLCIILNMLIRTHAHTHNSLLDLIWNIHLLEEKNWSQLFQSIDVGQLATKLVADEGLEENHHHTNEVGGVDNVHLL